MRSDATSVSRKKTKAPRGGSRRPRGEGPRAIRPCGFQFPKSRISSKVPLLLRVVPPQRAYLKGEGCTEAHGFLISRPFPADNLRRLLAGSEPARKVACGKRRNGLILAIRPDRSQWNSPAIAVLSDSYFVPRANGATFDNHRHNGGRHVGLSAPVSGQELTKTPLRSARS